jgi:hypothetical protein
MPLKHRVVEVTRTISGILILAAIIVAALLVIH